MSEAERPESGSRAAHADGPASRDDAGPLSSHEEAPGTKPVDSSHDLAFHAIPVNTPHGEASATLPMNPRDGIVSAATDEYRIPSLVTGRLSTTIVRVAAPAVASMIIMTLFATMDAFWVGRFIGAEGLAAVSTSVFWVWMLVAMAELVSVGLTAVAARRHGEGKPRQAARSVGDALVFALVLGVLVAVIGTIVLEWMFAVMHTPPEVSALGKRYLGMYLLGAPLIFGFFAVDAGFRASGDTRTPFYLLFASVAVALLLDPVLILGLGPAPSLGIAGAAVATVVPRGLAFGAGILLLHRRRMVTFGSPSPATLLAIARIGLPTALTGVTFSVIYVLLTRTTTQFGTPALAALGVGHRIESWSYMIGVGFGAATAAIVGQNLGAGQVARARRTGWIATSYATGVGLTFGTLGYVFAEPFAAIFTTSPEVIAESAHYLRINAIATAFIGMELVLEGALGGAGHTLPPMIASTSLTAVRIPLAAWAAVNWGTTGIWWVIAITALCRGIAMALLWRWGRWERQKF